MTGNIYHKRLMEARADLQTTTTALKLKYGCSYSENRLTPEERKSHYLLDVAHLDLCAAYAKCEAFKVLSHKVYI